MQTLNQLRMKINQVDAAIIKKLAARNKLSRQIGALKAKTGKKIIDKKREAELMEFYAALSQQYQLSPSYIKQLFKIVIAYSRQSQK